MHIDDFLNTYEDWEERIQSAPYNVEVKHDGEYVLLKYNQLTSDMSLTEVCESRGSIFRRKSEGWVCVCRPFDKFFNYGESYAADIDWDSAIVREKIDGSLMKVWYDDGWHLSTNGTIDAFKAGVSDFGITFGELFERGVGKNLNDFAKYFNKDWTYLFELVSPESRVVIYYDLKVYWLAAFETRSAQERYPAFNTMEGVYFPTYYDISNLEDCIAYVSSMDKDHEGVVVQDKYSNRIKVKSPEYLLAAHLVNNGAVTKKKLIEYIREDMVDDFLAYCPQYTIQIEQLKDRLSDLTLMMNATWYTYAQLMPTKKELALTFKDLFYRDFLFQKYDGKIITATRYIKQMPIDTLMKWLEEIEC